jgi:hypothetical protein
MKTMLTTALLLEVAGVLRSVDKRHVKWGRSDGFTVDRTLRKQWGSTGLFSCLIKI